MRVTRPVLLGVAGWLAIAVAATAGTVAALGALEDGITGSAVRPLDHDEVQRALDAPSTGPRSPGATGTPLPAGPGAVTQVLAAGGGTVTARCAADGVTLESWSPAQGFRADDLARGPAAVASLSFESEDEEYEVTVRCGPDGPVAEIVEDDGHRGRGGD